MPDQTPEEFAAEFASLYVDQKIDLMEYLRARDRVAALKRRADQADRLAEENALLKEQLNSVPPSWHPNTLTD